jgi:3-deoxy-D-manno-octulosonic-acid transferase
LLYWVYSLLLGAAMLVSLPYWLFQMLRHGKYRAGFGERLGRIPSRLRTPAGLAKPTIWVHAVSVGEVLAVTGLIAQLRRQFPEHRVVVTTTTDTGQALARTRFGEEEVFYFPMDFAFAIRPYLRLLRPRLVVIAETEFWPNFLRLARASGAAVAIVNARISDRSQPNYRRFRALLSRELANINVFLAQTEEDSSRLQSIGADPSRIQVAGNLKFDMPPAAPTPLVEHLRGSLRENRTSPVIVCGSTVEGEEPLVLLAFENVLVRHPRAAMILAPRHPERFDPVAILVQQMGIHFWRRSLWNGKAITGGVFLVDTIGELSSLYALADVAFVGGSLVPRGGHNIIEPALHGAAIVVGNYTENFRDIVSLFQSRDAVRIATAAEFPLTLMDLLANPAERAELGRRALETMKSQTGATQRTIDVLDSLLKNGPARPITSAVVSRQ